MLFTQAEGRNQAIDRLAYRVAAAAKRTIITGGFAAQSSAACFEHLQLQQALLDILRGRIVADALQHLAQDDIGESETLAIEFRVQPLRFRMTAAKMKDCRWLNPVLVAEIEFLEWTGEHHLRHTKFVALREDKPEREVRRE